MPLFEMINIDARYQYSTTRLFKNYLEEQGQYAVIIPESADTLVRQPAQADVKNRAYELGATFFMLADVNQLDETIIISMGLHATINGDIMWKDRQKVNNIDDIDHVLQAMARTMGTDQKAQDEGNIYGVTEYEAKELRQVKVRKSFGLTVGGAMILQEVYDENPFMAGGGAFWAYDARTMLFEVDAQWYGILNTYQGFVSIAAYKPFAPKRQTPFLGGGLGLSYSLVRFEEEYGVPLAQTRVRGTGLLAYLGGGYMLTRTSNVGIRIHGRYFVGAYKMNDKNETVPHGLLLNMDIYFGR